MAAKDGNKTAVEGTWGRTGREGAGQEWRGVWPRVESEGWWQGWRDRLEDGRKGSIITIYCKRGFVAELYISHPFRPIATRLILSSGECRWMFGRLDAITEPIEIRYGERTLSGPSGIT